MLVQERSWPGLNPSLQPTIREARLHIDSPAIRHFGKSKMAVATEGWKFPTPTEAVPDDLGLRAASSATRNPTHRVDRTLHSKMRKSPGTRLQPLADSILFIVGVVYFLMQLLDA